MNENNIIRELTMYQRVLIGFALACYIICLMYYFKHMALINAYNGVVIPSWSIPKPVSTFITMIRFTAFVELAALFLELVKAYIGGDWFGEKEREKEKQE